MMNINQAKRFTEEKFPAGPEELAAELGIEVREAPLTGCDGWVLSGPPGVIIRLNSTAFPTRRRFTLAHELGHLLLGIPSVVGESVYDSLKSNNTEERQVNDLAAELLLPESIVRLHLPSVPVVAKQLRKLAQKANVSELAAAIRVVNLAKEVGLVNAAVAFFKGDVFEWLWSRTLTMRPADATDLLVETKKTDPLPARIHKGKTNEVIVASIISNPTNQSSTLFVQLLPEEDGNRLSNAERRRPLEDFLFKDDNQFRMELQGVFGSFRPKCADWTLEVAFAEFYKQKGERWSGTRRTRLNSVKGREYVRLRLSEWCPAK
ncbi:MAG: ImmA/IrrE family metallo-endopeptidase [Gemmataceae bacterium]|nr:ImmA/IrrE family metallo-endopeptidase [Gemmataceae bacterium]